MLTSSTALHVTEPILSVTDGASRHRVLVVDDDTQRLWSVQGMLPDCDVDISNDGWSALERFDETRPDVVVAAVRAPRMDEWEMLRLLHRRDHDIPVVILGHADDRCAAVAAMREGARDYLLVPIEPDELRASIHRLAPMRDPDLAGTDDTSALPFGGLVGTSTPMQYVARLASRVAHARAALLLTGETGTGKGHLARAIHDSSPRADQPFVEVQPTGLVESLLESELFGHERGAFTGADHRRIGRFEQANHGTLFLDEVGEMPLSVQVKLLHVLQEHAFERVGGNQSVHVDVRVIAATNRNLGLEVEKGHFREDLYYRLNVVQIEMPPLRVRDKDVMLLAHAFLRKFAEESGKNIDGFSRAAQARLLGHAWPGNVRELENAVERAVVLCDGPRIEAADLHLEGAHGRPRPGLAKLADIEREAIISTLNAVESTQRAAEVLGISIRTIQYRLKSYGLSSRSRRTS